MNTPITYKTLRTISSDEQVTELAIWQLIRKGIIKSVISHGMVAVDIKNGISMQKVPTECAI